MTDTIVTEIQNLHHVFSDQLLAAEDTGHTIPCRGSDSAMWTSEDAADIEAATYRCASCPLINECRTYAATAGELVGVWGGINHTLATKGAQRRG